MALSRKRMKQRMRSVQNTMQITRAMQLVASSGLHRARARMEQSAVYWETWNRLMQPLLTDPQGRASRFCREETGRRICCVLIAGDRGLAGGFQSNLLRTAEEVFAKTETLALLPVGVRAAEYCRRRGDEAAMSLPETAAVRPEDCMEMAATLADGFREGRWDEAVVVYTRFHSVLQQTPTVQRLLPLTVSEQTEMTHRVWCEPEADGVLNRVVVPTIAAACYHAVCQSRASELAARSNAMDSAAKNAADMLDEMRLAYNQARQSAITQEITEIVGGAER